MVPAKECPAAWRLAEVQCLHGRSGACAQSTEFEASCCVCKDTRAGVMPRGDPHCHLLRAVRSSLEPARHRAAAQGVGADVHTRRGPCTRGAPLMGPRASVAPVGTTKTRGSPNRAPGELLHDLQRTTGRRCRTTRVPWSGSSGVVTAGPSRGRDCRPGRPGRAAVPARTPRLRPRPSASGSRGTAPCAACTGRLRQTTDALRNGSSDAGTGDRRHGASTATAIAAAGLNAVLAMTHGPRPCPRRRACANTAQPARRNGSRHQTTSAQRKWGLS